jgi:NADPH:quinone reductase-like Zn-dependent oxidoreductase
MYAVTINKYGDVSNLQIKEDLDVPKPKSNQLLVKVNASSVNPIDLMKREGYGKTIFEKQRKPLFPWVLGSDFSGTVVEVGSKISGFNIDDEVWGCSSNANSGTHSEFVCIDVDEVTHKPRNINHLEAASLPYAALTTWSALVRWSGLRPNDLSGKKVFIQGGAGGVGCFSIQLFKSLGCEVATTCSKKNIELVKSLGANQVIDYNEHNFEDVLHDFDIAYDLLGDSVLNNSIERCCNILNNSSDSHYITLTHPLVNTLDSKGLLMGVPHALYLRQKQKQKFNPINIHWSIYRPSLSGLEQLTQLVEDETIKPIIDSIYPIGDLSSAHEKIATGHVSGKVVIDHKI